MKRIFSHPQQPETGRKYWRSLEEAADSPEFQEQLRREFPAGAAEFDAGGVSRRDFLKLMGASMALAGLGTAGCRRREGQLVPYTKSVEWVIPGRALYYASAMPRRGGALPLVVTTFEGRPTHVDGNSLVPGYNRGADTQAQAAILDMYDPDRVWNYAKLQLGEGSTKELIFGQNLPAKGFKKVADELAAKRRAVRTADFIEAFKKLAAGLGTGAGVAILLEPSTSPTRARILAEVRRKFPQLMVAEYSPLADPTVIPSLGAGVKIRNQYGAAKKILALDCDFLCNDDAAVLPSKQFGDGRRIDDNSDIDAMNRLYVVESAYTITGGMADHRLRLAPSQCAVFARVFAEELVAGGAAGSLAAILGAMPALPIELPFDRAWAAEAAKDFLASRGRSLFVAGPRQPEIVRLLALAINEALGNIGTTVQLLQAPAPDAAPVSIQELAAAIGGGSISTLFVVGGNPVYNAPADLKWAELQAKVANVIRVGFHDDETSAICDWLIPQAHTLECWSDDFTPDGTYVAIQPMILPLNDGLTDLELLTLLNGAELTRGPEFVRATFDQLAAGGAGEGRTWTDFLRDGFLAGSAFPPASVNIASAAGTLPALVAPPVPTLQAMEIQLKADAKLDDGRYNNNGWLQELPEPVSKLTWDNVALVSAKTAQELGLYRDADGNPKGDGKKRLQFYNEEGKYDLIKITVEGRELEMPAMVSMGQADNVVTIALGYGRTRTGRVGVGSGFNAYPLITSTSGLIQSGATVVKSTPEAYMLAFAQMYSFMEGRALVREGTLAEFVEHRGFAQQLGMDAHIPPNVSLYKTPPYAQLSEMQWGMTIDLNQCTGCSACTVACQSENNIPIVGKIQVNKGRELQWIRMDRYFASADTQNPLDDANPQMIVQPVACVHCENAPCETVCPVNATVHSEDGLNVMAYNRCIGTRYCANNCPYKARRFNFFDFNDRPVGKITFEEDEKVPWYKRPTEGRDKLELGPLTKKGMEESLKLSKNPNVTVRMRGVMEKCTYCVQRIETAKIDQRIKAKDSPNTRVPANVITTACQDACATGAIVFGDIANAESDVSKMKLQKRNYRIIEYLNTQARTSYLARVRNPNESMPDFAVMYPDHKTKARVTYDHHHEEGEHDEHAHEPMPGANAAGAGAVPPKNHAEAVEH